MQHRTPEPTASPDAVVAAALTTILARTSGDTAPTAFAVNAAGMSLGTFVGALLALALCARIGSPPAYQPDTTNPSGGTHGSR